ncbi:unnamed protein product, partial [Gulo gulo]
RGSCAPRLPGVRAAPAALPAPFAQAPGSVQRAPSERGSDRPCGLGTLQPGEGGGGGPARGPLWSPHAVLVPGLWSRFHDRDQDADCHPGPWLC